LDEKEGKKFEVYKCHICSHWEVRAAGKKCGKKCGRKWGFKVAAPGSNSGGELWERGPPSIVIAESCNQEAATET
jgi:hypothetical protein